MKNILIVVGTRPNYIKVTQFKKVANSQFKDEFNIKIVHTGQHFDKAMSDVFFQQLDIAPDYFLNIPQGSPNNQMGEIMIRLENLIISEFKPDLILVPGDVNSTLAAALCSYKLNIPLGHLESGLRSFDRSMPEEINRIVVDEISDFFFVTEQSGIDNLIKEGKCNSKIFFVGNTMIDTLVAFEQEIDQQGILTECGLVRDNFILMTIHRPATVDSEEGLELLLSLIKDIPGESTIAFPIHPRTLNNIKKYGLEDKFKKQKHLLLLEPLDYFNFQNLVANCQLIITDSGGIQEETTYKQKPCITIRPNTERPITTSIGSNTLLNFDKKEIIAAIKAIKTGNYKKGKIPELWDGKSTERVLRVLQNRLT